MGRSLLATTLSLAVLFSLLLTGCSSSDNNKSTDDGIDTLNIFFENGEIISFDPDTLERRVRASYLIGDNMIFPMNTNDEKQGYEYAAFVNSTLNTDDSRSIFLFNYVNAELTELARVDGQICGIHPRLGISERSFENQDNLKNIATHQHTILIETNNVLASCSADINTFYKLDYELENESAESQNISIKEVSSSQSYGDTLIDYETTDGNAGSFLSTGNILGQTAFLGYDFDGRQLELFNSEDTLLWSVYLPYTSAFPTIQQVTRNEVLVQVDNDVFIVNIPLLLSPQIEDSEVAIDIPGESNLDALFSQPASFISASLSTHTGKGSKNFLLEDGDTLYNFDDNDLTPVYSKSDDSDLLNLNFETTAQNSILLLKEFTDSQVLTRINPENNVESSLFSAERIELRVINDDVYINTLNSNGYPGWQAHWIDEDLSTTTYDDHQFMFMEDINLDEPKIFFIQTTPGIVYEFDPLQTDGIKEFNHPDTGEKDFIVGVLSADYNSNTSEPNIIVNDQYAYFFSGTDRYYYNPDETEEFKLIHIQ